MKRLTSGNLISILSWEFLTRSQRNGGTVVFYRTVLVSTQCYLLAILVRARLTVGATWGFDANVARQLIVDTMPWYGAIFAGVYAALYARFASQWAYLAGLYNQIMATAIQFPPPNTDSTKILRLWQAGFVEDAMDLHLAAKPMFATVIRSMLEKDGVREAIISSTDRGERRLKDLEKRLKRDFPRPQ